MIDKKMCAHHWMIEPPNGPMSRGVCWMCKKEKSFSNVVELRDISGWSKVATGRANREDGGD